jgi:hypothetical protein
MYLYHTCSMYVYVVACARTYMPICTHTYVHMYYVCICSSMRVCIQTQTYRYTNTPFFVSLFHCRESWLLIRHLKRPNHRIVPCARSWTRFRRGTMKREPRTCRWECACARVHVRVDLRILIIFIRSKMRVYVYMHVCMYVVCVYIHIF